MYCTSNPINRQTNLDFGNEFCNFMLFLKKILHWKHKATNLWLALSDFCCPYWQKSQLPREIFENNLPVKSSKLAASQGIRFDSKTEISGQAPLTFAP